MKRKAIRRKKTGIRRRTKRNPEPVNFRKYSRTATLNPARKKGKKQKFSLAQMRAGIKVEMEHTKRLPKSRRYAAAKRIATDHLREFPDYYTRHRKCFPEEYRKKRNPDYERMVHQIRGDPRLFDAPESHKIHRVLRKAIKHKVARYPKPPVGPYSGLTRGELARSGTVETDWYNNPAASKRDLAELKRLEQKDDLTSYEKDRLYELQMKHGTPSERRRRSCSCGRSPCRCSANPRKKRVPERLGITYQEWKLASSARDAAVSTNRSRSIKGLPRVEVPPKPELPLAYYAYDKDGTYEGRLKARMLEEARREAPGFEIVAQVCHSNPRQRSTNPKPNQRGKGRLHVRRNGSKVTLVGARGMAVLPSERGSKYQVGGRGRPVPLKEALARAKQIHLKTGVFAAVEAARNPSKGKKVKKTYMSKGYAHKVYIPNWKRVIDPRSIRTRVIRTKKGGKRLIRFGCPKGQWMPKKKWCRVGTKAISIMTPREEKVLSLPRGRSLFKVGNPARFPTTGKTGMAFRIAKNPRRHSRNDDERVMSYKPGMRIRNLQMLSRGLGAKYLIVIPAPKSDPGAWVAKAWARERPALTGVEHLLVMKGA